jgi:tetratricopeptide (TPR) repeat protein
MTVNQSRQPTQPETGIAGSDKPVTPAERRRLQTLFEQATQLVSDYDMANKLLTECVVGDPGNVVYVEAFLRNLEHKYRQNKTGARIRVFYGKGAFKKAVAKQQWHQVFRLGPAVLKTNPWDVSTLCAMATACEKQHDPLFDEVELRYLRNALAAAPLEIGVHRQVARLLSRMARFDEALAHWESVRERNPNDEEAQQAMSYLTGKALSARPTEPSEAEASAARTEPRDVEAEMLDKQLRRIVRRPQAEPAPSLDDAPCSPQRREIKLTRRQVLEHQIQADPSELSSYLELSDILCFHERYGEAKQVLLKAQNVSPGDVKVRERLEDVELRQARNRLAVAEMQAAKLETNATYQLVESLRAELQQLEIEQYAIRCQRYPQDLGLTFEFALRLKRAGRFSEALRHLQEAFKDPHQRAGALIAMGECCQHLKQFEKALNHYLAATRCAELPDQKDCHLLANYRAGALATAMGHHEQARRCLERVLDVDPDYKDVRSRVDKLRQISDKT